MALCVAQLSKREEEKSKIEWGGGGGEALGLARGDVLHLAGLRGNTGTQGGFLGTGNRGGGGGVGGFSRTEKTGKSISSDKIFFYYYTTSLIWC